MAERDTGDMRRESAVAPLVAGIDLGSTSLKMLVTDEAGAEVGRARVPTPWRAGPGGCTEITAEALLAAVRSLLDTTARVTAAPIEAIAIAGMAETGMVVDERGEAVVPGMAWFDPRGAEQAAAFPADVRAEFAGRTGLPLGAQVSVAKLAWLRDHGVRLKGLRWLNVPEFVAAALGGRTALERSLTSRTGLLDQACSTRTPAARGRKCWPPSGSMRPFCRRWSTRAVRSARPPPGRSRRPWRARG
jgi:sugar (pentulose or hexulose) kinase